MTKTVVYHVPSEAPLAFKATYADFRLVKTRKTAQFVFEVPIEGADAALKALGGVPRPDCETWVAVARLDPALEAREPDLDASEPRNAPDKASAPRERRPFKSLPLPAQAAMRCNDPEFLRFLAEYLFGPGSGIAIPTVEEAADEVRQICGVTSRSKISEADESGTRWRELDRAYLDWRHSVHSYEGVAR